MHQLQEELGYDNVVNVDGGILAWQEEGLPVDVAEGMTAEQRERYSRHTLLPEVGVEGQIKLLNAKVLLLGAGGLGSPTALYLAAAGIGTLGIVDDDVVDESNLQRQVIHTTDRVGTPKTESAQGLDRRPEPRRRGGRAPHPPRRLEHPRDHPRLRHHRRRRRQLPDALPAERRFGAGCASPVVSASILAFEGQISTFMPFEGPCYRCLYPTPPPAELAPSCGAAGVLGVMAGVMGLLQANEVIKLVAGIGEPLIGRLLLYDSLGTRFTELKVRRDPSCPICGPDAPEMPESEMGKFPDYELFCR